MKKAGTVKKIAWNVTKVAAVLAINATILMVLVGDEEDVTEPQQAHADIADFMSQKVFASPKTSDVVESSGMTPQPFNLNGNKLYYAVGKTPLSPRQILDHYQTEFVASGVNSKKWLEQPQQKMRDNPDKFEELATESHEMIGAMNDGEVVPYLVSDDYVSMGGPILTGNSFKEIYDEWGDTVFADTNTVWKGWRFIEAERTEKGYTRVTSFWADEDFDFKKFKNPSNAKLGLNPAVPACPGCELVMRSRGEEDNAVALEQWHSQQDTDTVMRYYIDAMKSRGWELADTTQVMNYVASEVPDHPFNTHGKMLTFAKGDHLVTYSILKSDSGTSVTASESW